MGEIKKLTKKVANQISAGEVIERPASIVKELVENSIDAKADKIEITVKEGGKEKIKIQDNGEGIVSEQVELAFSRYATSKIKGIDDIYSLYTLGFRGEALASIAAVSHVIAKTRHISENSGTHIELKGGEIIKKKKLGLPTGTEIMVKDLFYNTPARYKYLKKTSTEAARINKLVTSLALANPDIKFVLENENGEVLSSPGNGSLKDNIYSLYGEEVYNNLITIDFSEKFLEVSGCLVNPSISRSSRQHEYFFVNNRPVNNKFLRMAVEEAYGARLPSNKYPLVFLNINLNPILVDVNVHPTKKEVKFSRGEIIKEILQNKLSEILQGQESHSEFPNLNEKIRSSTNKKPIEKEQKYREPGPNINPGMTQKSSTDKADYAQKNLFPTNTTFKENKKNYLETKAVENKQEPTEDLAIENWKLLGQLHNLFILLQTEKGLLIVDQHNAHERIIFDDISQKVNEKDNDSRLLLTPLPLELSPQEKEIVNDLKLDLENIGFQIEKFGPSSYVLAAVPNFLEEETGRENLSDIINQILDKAKMAAKDEIIKEILLFSACRQAIKEGESLSEVEMKRIIENLFKSSNPYRCPHHRPITVRITLKQLNKMVDR